LEAYLLGGSSLEIVGHLAFAAGDGIFVETGNLGHEADASMSETLGFDSGVPASLLFVQTTQKQVDLLMSQPLRMVGFLLTCGTFTLMEGTSRHKFSRKKEYAYSTLKTELVVCRGLTPAPSLKRSPFGHPKFIAEQEAASRHPKSYASAHRISQ